MRLFLPLSIFGLLLALPGAVFAQRPASGAPFDTDHDGLADEQESALLRQFEPRFNISRDDCSLEPAQFTPFLVKPVALADDGTIYGQAFPRPGHAEQVELHYYHLWRKDCGKRGHDLDAEHVSALLHREDGGVWKALYWYAAAHEDTLCDASQIARATALDAEGHGPQVWISSGKHATFLGQAMCSRGCGGDRCREMEPLAGRDLINLGEVSAPMNGASWITSPEWPLGEKLRRSDFAETRTARLDRLPANDIAWASPKKRPAQAAILGGDDAIAGVGTGLRATDSALTVADTHTDAALNKASGNTGNALAKTYRGVKKALRATVHGTGRALGEK